MTKTEYSTVFSLLETEHQPTMLEQFSHYTPFQQLIATLLSSRTKDTTTIPLVEKMFKQYQTPQDFVMINVKELESLLYGIGFYKVKAQNIKKSSKIIIENYANQIPQNFEELTSLPGVGPKTANCILSNTFHLPAIAVDVHVHRISNRLGWVQTTIPEQTEEQLKKTIPKELWNKVNPLLVDHGQRICLPRTPRCENCLITKYCQYYRKSARKPRPLANG